MENIITKKYTNVTFRIISYYLFNEKLTKVLNLK